MSWWIGKVLNLKMLCNDCSRIFDRICQGRGQKNFIFQQPHNFPRVFQKKSKLVRLYITPFPLDGGPVWVKSVCHPDGVGVVELNPRYHFTPKNYWFNVNGKAFIQSDLHIVIITNQYTANQQSLQSWKVVHVLVKWEQDQRLNSTY